MKTFENKTVLITGGTSGIGKATALAFAKEGANVVVSGRRVAEGEEVAREITSAGGSSMFVSTDVGGEDDIVALVEKTVGAFGALHIAFNNAGTEASSARSLPSRRSSTTTRFVRLVDSPDEYFVFQKVDRFENVQLFPVGKSVRQSHPLAIFIGPAIPEQEVRASAERHLF
jgi:NAD(P)-dependent dehydrogenase (short-subunit alcohol dehydrogenase family)